MVDCSLSNIAEVANLLLDDVTLWLEEILQTNFVSNKMLILKLIMNFSIKQISTTITVTYFISKDAEFKKKLRVVFTAVNKIISLCFFKRLKYWNE